MSRGVAWRATGIRGGSLVLTCRYFTNVMLDVTVGLLVTYLLLRVSAWVVHIKRLHMLRSGDYGTPPKWRVSRSALALLLADCVGHQYTLLYLALSLRALSRSRSLSLALSLLLSRSLSALPPFNPRLRAVLTSSLFSGLILLHLMRNCCFCRTGLLSYSFITCSWRLKSSSSRWCC
jgi:hypothetical protein